MIVDKNTRRQILESLKNQPDWLQNLNLVMVCKMDEARGGFFEKFARILAEYGVSTEKIMPCMMDLMLVIEDMSPDITSLPEHGS